jgi:Fe2+ transport system protein B
MGMNKNIMVMNLKQIKIMKSCGYTDQEIAKSLGIKVTEFLSEIGEDEYLKEVYDTAAQKVVTEIEEKFLKNVFTSLEAGDNTDAKWLLERLNKKYQKTDKMDVTLRTIDDVIREAGDE